MRPIIYFFILFAFSTTVVAQNKLVEILADSLYSSEVNDQSSAATGDPLLISAGVYGGQSFIADTTGILTRIEITTKKNGASVSNLSLEIRTGSDPALGTSLITESIEVLSAADSIYSIVLTTPIAVTKGDTLVMIVQKTGGGDAEWQRSSSDVYAGGTAFLNASGWLPPLSNRDHWFSSYVEVSDSAIVSYFSVAADGLIKAKNRITNVNDPISAQDAATKAYVDLLETSIPAYTIGDFAQGGIVFWVDETGQHGLVCAKSNQSSGIRWYAGTYGTTRAKGDGVYAGAANTVIIISSQVAIGDDGSPYAAQLCNDLQITEGGTTFGDWYLPSKYELDLMNGDKATIDATAVANGGVGFADDWYWSSTESDDNSAWFQDFSGIVSGYQNFGTKSYLRPVRAVRAF